MRVPVSTDLEAGVLDSSAAKACPDDKSADREHRLQGISWTTLAAGFHLGS